MSDFSVKHFDSWQELRRNAPAWDDLWLRSDSVRPTAQAEQTSLWCQAFAAERPLRSIVVEHDGSPVAAIPILMGRKLGLRTALLPGNAWSPAGELLIDPTCDVPRACEVLLNSLRKLDLTLLAADGAALDAPAWHAIAATAQQTRHAHAERTWFAINLVEVATDWSTYYQSRSYNHRRQLRTAAVRASKEGELNLERHDHLTPDQVEPLLRVCFQMEAEGWKGRTGGAVLCTPGVWQFFVEQAKRLAVKGQLSLTLLNQAERPIAFEYSWRAKGVHAILKIGYDESARHLTPGQLLRHLLFEQLFNEGATRWIDFLGPAQSATSKWRTGQYRVGHSLISLSRIVGNSAVRGYRIAGPTMRTLRRQAKVEASQDSFLPPPPPHTDPSVIRDLEIAGGQVAAARVH